MMDLGFWIIVACAVIVTVLCAIAFVRWNKIVGEWDYAIQMLHDVAIFLDALRRELNIEIDEPDKPEITE